MVHWRLSLLSVLISCTCVSHSESPVKSSTPTLKVHGTRHLAGHNLKFQCVYANGSVIPASVSVLWEKEDAPLSISADRVRIVKAERVLYIMHSLQTDSGRYSCVAGGIRSQGVEIAVVVVPEPEVNLARKNFTCLVGESLHVRLLMQNIVAFQLMHGGEDVSHRRYQYFSNNSTLVVFSLQLLDAGLWSIYAGNAVGALTVNFSVIMIDGQPTTRYNTNQTQMSGESNVSLIIGVTIGSLVVVALISVALMSLWLRSRRSPGNYKLDSKAAVDLDQNATILDLKT